jgi:hypothetical protein
MNAYKVEKVTTIDGAKLPETKVEKIYTDYRAAVGFAKEHGCTQAYGDIESGTVTMVDELADDIVDAVYGKKQTAVTISQIEIE